MPEGSPVGANSFTLFCQLGRVIRCEKSPVGCGVCQGKLKHLGIAAPSRSSLAYANAHRPWQLYQRSSAFCRRVRQKSTRAKPFRFKNKLVSLDSTTIDLCLSMFDSVYFRRTKGAIKLHLLRTMRVTFLNLPGSPRGRWPISKLPTIPLRARNHRGGG